MIQAGVLPVGIYSWLHLLYPNLVCLQPKPIGVRLRLYLKTNIRSLRESQSFREGQKARGRQHDLEERMAIGIRIWEFPPIMATNITYHSFYAFFSLL